MLNPFPPSFYGTCASTLFITYMWEPSSYQSDLLHKWYFVVRQLLCSSFSSVESSRVNTYSTRLTRRELYSVSRASDRLERSRMTGLLEISSLFKIAESFSVFVCLVIHRIGYRGTQVSQVGRWTSEQVRGALVHRRGRKYLHDWLYLQSINTLKHQ